MEHESEIKRLEDIVERLLEGYTGLKAEIRKKEQEVRAQQAENDQLRQQVKTMDSERGDLGGRVSSLIDRIEIWESELESAEFEDDPSVDPGDEPDSGSKGAKEPADDHDDEEAGGGVQGSLFTANSNSR
jgi:predicted nuclease with TOPRIM domain